MPKIAYYCDPEKNTQCKKSNCYLNGGTCKITLHFEFAKDPDKKVLLTLEAPNNGK